MDCINMKNKRVACHPFFVVYVNECVFENSEQNKTRCIESCRPHAIKNPLLFTPFFFEGIRIRCGVTISSPHLASANKVNEEGGGDVGRTPSAHALAVDLVLLLTIASRLHPLFFCLSLFLPFDYEMTQNALWDGVQNREKQGV
jgi:hypothetical protein